MEVPEIKRFHLKYSSEYDTACDNMETAFRQFASYIGWQYEEISRDSSNYEMRIKIFHENMVKIYSYVWKSSIIE